jgi:hypothetical protein
MQNGVRLNFLRERGEARVYLGISDGQNAKTDANPRAREPRTIFGEPSDHLGGRIFDRARKTVKARDKDA